MDYEIPKNRKDVKFGIKQKLLKVMKEGGVIIFDLDDSPCRYTEKYDPDYKQFYDRSAIHQHIWDPEKLLHKEVWTQYSGIEELPSKQYTVSYKIYQVVVWSKFRIDSNEDDPTILEKVELKFNKTLPLDHLNLLFCVALDDEQTEPELKNDHKENFEDHAQNENQG